MNDKQIKEFFGNFGIKIGVKYKSISLARLRTIIQTAEAWHGTEFAQFVFKCFVPNGENIPANNNENWVPNKPIKVPRTDPNSPIGFRH